MKRIIIYDTSISGHHMEYLHHIYMATEGKNAEFIFVIPKEFVNVKDKLLWPNRTNVSFDLIPDSEIRNCVGGWFHSRWKQAILCNKYIRKHRVQEVFFIELIIQMPFLPLLVSKEVKLSGILYQLVPYKWNSISLFLKIKCGIEILSYAKNNCVKTPLILNDSSCACYYNRLFHTDKFISIVDPVMVSDYMGKSIRDTLNLNENDRMLLHFGEMSDRKGTLLLLDAIDVLTEEQLLRRVFVFAGRVSDNLKEQFYQKVERVRKKARVYVFDEFCSYEFLSDLCYSCDLIVVPSKITCCSSGVIGRSSLFHKSILGPDKGVLRKLIRRNHLGVTFVDYTAQSLADAMLNEECYIRRDGRYAENNSVETFTNAIMNSLLQY